MNNLISVTDTAGQIRIGVWCTSNVNSQSFDFSEWVEKFGAGELTILHQRNGDEYPYEVDANNITIENNIATWNFDAVDSSKIGFGKACLVYTVGNDVVARTVPYTTLVCASLGESGEQPPDPWDEWFNRVLQASTDAEEAADNAALSAESANTSRQQAQQSAASITNILPLLLKYESTYVPPLLRNQQVNTFCCVPMNDTVQDSPIPSNYGDLWVITLGSSPRPRIQILIGQYSATSYRIYYRILSSSGTAYSNWHQL